MIGQQKQHVESSAADWWLRRLAVSLDRTSLTENERWALAEFLAALQTTHARDIETVILYGSAARRETRHESDVDLLVLTRRTLSKAEVAAIQKVANELGLDHHALLNVLMMSPDEQRWHGRGSSLWRNIQRDGISLWPSSPNQLRLDTEFRYRKNPASEAYTMTEAQYDEIKIYLEHSTEELAAAEVLIQSGMERLAISRCYYAIFYATTALLLTKGIVRARHGGTRSALGEFFIRSGEIPGELGDLYTLLQNERELADYKMAADPPWEDIVENRLERAKAFVETIKAYLIQHNFLSS